MRTRCGALAASSGRVVGLAVGGLVIAVAGRVVESSSPPSAAGLSESRADAYSTRGARIVNACELRLIEAASLLRLADLFVGPSSGPLNLAAAGATPAFGLFGSTPALTYSKFINAIVPDGGPAPGGMARISPAQVLERIAPYLSRRKVQA